VERPRRLIYHYTVIIVCSQDIDYIFKVHWLKEEPVRSVEIRRDRFGIVVDDMDFHAFFPQGLDCVHGAVIELDSLADPDWSGTEDEHFLAITGNDLTAALMR
jgi:hypothetical protein